jgi:hypothetical protein
VAAGHWPLADESQNVRCAVPVHDAAHVTCVYMTVLVLGSVVSVPQHTWPLGQSAGEAHRMVVPPVHEVPEAWHMSVCVPWVGSPITQQ